MNKQLFISIAVGAIFTYLFIKAKKPCGCNGHAGDETITDQVMDGQASVSTNSSEKVDECSQAVDLIMAEISKFTNLSEADFNERRAFELNKCRQMSNA